MQVRRARLALAVALVLPLAATWPSAPAVAATGDITTVAGSFGEGPALKVSQRVRSLVARGTSVYMGDETRHVVRRFDTTTGTQTIVAGDGTDDSFSEAPLGDGGPATATSLGFISALALDAAGNLYIADSRHHRIRKMDLSGTITTVAGDGTEGDAGDGGPARAASLGMMWGLAFDGAGNLFVSTNSRIRKIDLLGTITTVAGTGTQVVAAGSSPDGIPATQAQINAYGVTVDGDGNLYFNDGFSLRIRKVSPQGIISTFAHVCAWDMILRPGGGLYTAGCSQADEIDGSGRVTRLAGTGVYGSSGDGGPAIAATLKSAGPLALDGQGNLYIADANDYVVRRVDRARVIDTVAGNGTFSTGGDGGRASDAQLEAADDVALGPDGAVYIAESFRHRVRRIDRAGIISTFAGTTREGDGGDGGPAIAADLRQPTKVAVDGAGNVYIADAEALLVRKVDLNGVISTVAGNGAPGSTGDGGPATAAAVGAVGDLATDPSGNLYLADTATSRVRKVDPAGTITALAGTGDAGFAGDGGPATAARLNRPSGLAVDPVGALLIADTSNGRVRRVTPGGAITTVASIGSPLTVESDRAGGVFVGDRAKVYRVTPTGTVTVAGTGTLGYSGDGGPATRADLSGVAGLAFDGADLYIAATYSRRVRKVTSADAIRPVATTTTTVPATTTTAPAPPAGTRTTAWGLNHLGQVGGGRVPATVTAPVEPSQLGLTTAVAGGWSHSLAASPDGTVRAWGWNHFGQLGTGSTLDSTQTMAVTGLTDVWMVAAGVAHSLALKHDGTVWAWGYNGQGQLGTGSMSDSRRPVQVPGLTGVTSIAAGGYHSLAVKGDGSVWAWGWNGYGGLGDTTTTDRWSPVPVSGLSGAGTVAAGAYHSLAVKHDGTVWSWGLNSLGQLGTGSVADSHQARRVTGLTGVRGISGGFAHSIAIGQGGQVWTWGWNGLGQLGNGTTTNASTPVAVAGVTGAVSLAAGAGHSLVGLVDGTVWAWGWNGYGQLGIGATTDRLRPAPARATGTKTLAAGAAHSVAR